MGRQAWAIGTLILLLCVGASGMVSANTDSTYEPGFIEWEINPLERLFVEGSDVEEAVLQRGQTDSAVGGFTVGLTNGPVPVFTLQSPPVEQPVEAQVFMSVYFSAIIEGGGGPQSCTRQTWTDSSTTLIYSVSDGTGEIYSTEVTQTLDTSAEGDAMNFSGEVQNATLILDVGQSITLTVSVEHRCIGTQARVQWGGFEQNSGGIVIEGVLYEPKADITVDAARLAHVELEHRLPWGLEDLRDEKWEIWGPLLPTDKSVRDGEYLVETSAGRIRMTRDMGGNNTLYTWSGAEPLPVGELNLQFCLRTVAGDLNSECHAEGILRFEVTGGDDGFASAGLWLTITTLLALVGFVVNAFRTGLMLPVPILGALAVLALLTLPTVFDQPNLGADAVILDNTKILDADLASSDGETLSVSELLNGHEALLIGLVLPGSEQILTQSNEFNRSIDQLGDRVNVVHIITGEDARMTDVTSLSAATNATWNVYLDEKGVFAKSLPTGASDAVVVVDPGMHVAFSQTSSAAMLDIVEAVDGIKTGYIRASGFNLVASTKRYGRRLIGVVFGGKSAKSRDRHMRKLFNRAYALIPKKKTDYPASTAEAIEMTKKSKIRLAKAAYPRKSKPNRDRVRRWAIQVGAFSQSSAARLAAYGAAGRLQDRGVAQYGQVAIVMHQQARNRLYRAQIVGMSQRDAVKSCSYLRAQQHACVAIPPITQ